MRNVDDIERLEKLIGQLRALHHEIGLLSKKSPTDGLNKFKLSIINNTVSFANGVLGEKYAPFEDFEGFDVDDVPSNSDVTMVLAQYIEEAERFRSAHVVPSGVNRYYYLINGEVSDVRAAPPTWSKK